MPALVWTLRNSQRGLTRKVSSLVILSGSSRAVAGLGRPARSFVALRTIKPSPAQRRGGASQDRTAAHFRFGISLFVHMYSPSNSQRL